MQEVTRYVASDGSEWVTPAAAKLREHLLGKIDEAMRPLGSHPQLRPKEYAQHATGIRDRVATRLAALGATADDARQPVMTALGRLFCIDDQDREWEQPYFASHPPADAVCVNDRR